MSLMFQILTNTANNSFIITISICTYSRQGLALMIFFIALWIINSLHCHYVCMFIMNIFFLLYKRFSNKKKDCFYYIVIELLKKKSTNQIRLIKGIEIIETFLDKIILKEKNHLDVMNNILLMQNM
jgi:hypothetical protein